MYATRSDYIRHALIEQLRVDGYYRETQTPETYMREQTIKRLPTRFIGSIEDGDYAINEEWFEDDKC